MLSTKIKTEKLTSYDRLNSIEWKGTIQFTAASEREYTHGHQFSTKAKAQNDAWSDWKKPNLAAYTFLIEKKNGALTSKRRTPQHLNAIPCSEIPK